MKMNNIYLSLFFIFTVCSALQTPKGFQDLQRKSKGKWIREEKAKENLPFSITVGLKQRNVEAFKEHLNQIANPQTDVYGQWMKKQEVLDMIAPPKEDQQYVIEWFEQQCRDVKIDNYQDALKIKTSVDCIEKIFKVTIYKYKHTKTQQIVLKADVQKPESSVPKDIDTIVELISGIHDFPKIGARSSSRETVDSDATTSTSPTSDNSNYNYNIPATARALYNIPENLKIEEKSNSNGVIEFSPEGAPYKSDLQEFAKQNNLEFYGINQFNGPDNPDGATESVLDVEYMTSIALGGDMAFTTISDGWIYEMAVELFNLKKTPLVNSISYSWMESLTCKNSDVTNANCSGITLQQYITRSETELAKLGSVGVTIVASSGDEETVRNNLIIQLKTIGAPSIENEFCGEDETTPLYPMYPASSEYVLSVGAATIIAKNNDKKRASLPPICNGEYTCSTGGLEVPCMENNTDYEWTAGGGVSNLIKTPSYQSSVVANYKKAVAQPPTKYYNPNGRFYPDTTAMGDRILIIDNGSVTAGTSASTPIIGGIVALLNDHRLKNGKPALGFINPLWYQMGTQNRDTFNDIKTGTNKWSRASEPCKYGYLSTAGFDAVNGFGSPNFGEMIKYIDSLDN